MSCYNKIEILSMEHNSDLLHITLEGSYTDGSLGVQQWGSSDLQILMFNSASYDNSGLPDVSNNEYFGWKKLSIC